LSLTDGFVEMAELECPLFEELYHSLDRTLVPEDRHESDAASGRAAPRSYRADVRNSPSRLSKMRI
jgi:hypothetical protein